MPRAAPPGPAPPEARTSRARSAFRSGPPPAGSSRSTPRAGWSTTAAGATRSSSSATRPSDSPARTPGESRRRSDRSTSWPRPPPTRSTTRSRSSWATSRCSRTGCPPAPRRAAGRTPRATRRCASGTRWGGSAASSAWRARIPPAPPRPSWTWSDPPGAPTMAAASADAGPGGVFYGWTVVTAAGLVLFMAYGTQYAFGVFFAALVEEFGWSRASLSGVFSLYAGVYSGFALVAGRLTDRWGPRAVIAVGGALLGVALAAMSGVGALWQPYVLYGTVAALGMSTAYVPCNATVAKWFTRRRGLAVGLASAGGSLGTFALPPLAHFLVSRLGWRWAYVVFGTAILVALNALALLMRREPEAIGLAPDGDRAPPVRAPAAAARGAHGWTIRRALRSPAFWLLFGVFAGT